MDFTMDEDKLERIYEREMDRLDSQLMRGSISQEEYDAEERELNSWINDAYKRIQRACF